MANEIAYGFIRHVDAFDRLVTDVGVEVVETAIAQTIEEYNRIVNDFTSLFVRPTTAFQTVYRTTGSNRLQPIDADGRALPVKTGAQYTVAWPIRRGATAWGEGYEGGIRMTVGHANELVNLMTTGDKKWILDHIMAALFKDGSYTFADEQHGDLTILPLANGDTQTYYTYGGSGTPATANHYLGQADAIDDDHNPYKTIRNLLKSYTDNSGQVVALIASNLVSDTENLSLFRTAPDPNITPGALDSRLTGSLGVALPSGRPADGYVDGVWISEWEMIPDNYIIAVITGGERPVAMREDPLAQLRGFRQVGTREDFPWLERQYRRMAGFGAWNRVGAAVMEIGDATYDPPVTGQWDFDNPMP